ncbi:MAG TPA: hypothetical protein VNI01_12290, partial [Elusimicrobiota bacterium]|nr:hypothetical protein [Elusimicrobiota bacterium]
MPAASIAVLLAALALAKDGKNDAVLSQEITIRGRGPSGPEVSMPAPAMDAQAIDEVIRSLELYKGAAPMSKPPRAAGPAKRVAKPFPPPPYLVLDASAVTQPCNRWT